MIVWIFLRGLGRESRHWGNFPQAFQHHVPNAQVLALDLPGNGRYWQQHSPRSIDAMVEHCRMQLTEQQIKPPYNLLALSLGAMVAAAWCVRHPQEISRGVFINTSFRTFSPFWQRLRPGCYPILLRLIISSRDLLRREQQVLRLTSREHANDHHVSEGWAGFAMDAPLSRRNVARQIFAALQFRVPATAQPVPLLILASAGDRMVNPRCSKAIAKNWNTPCALHPSAGHDLPLDDSAWVIEKIIDWINDQSQESDFSFKS